MANGEIAKTPGKLQSFLSHLLIIILGTTCFLYFRVINHTRVIGRKNIPKKSSRTILVSNHESMHDSWVIGIAGYYPEIVFYPSRTPYNLAAKENFFGGWVIGKILKLLRTIPVERGRFNRELLKLIGNLINEANVCIFYQGTRSADLNHAKNGVAFLIANTTPPPTVIPVFVNGTGRFFGGKPGSRGLSRWFPRFPGFGRKISVVFGPPIDFSDLRKEGRSSDLYVKITARIIQKVADLRSQLFPPST